MGRALDRVGRAVPGVPAGAVLFGILVVAEVGFGVPSVAVGSGTSVGKGVFVTFGVSLAEVVIWA